MSRYFLSYVVLGNGNHAALMLSEKGKNSDNAVVVKEFGFIVYKNEYNIFDKFKKHLGYIHFEEDIASRIMYSSARGNHITYEISKSEKEQLELILANDLKKTSEFISKKEQLKYNYFRFNCKSYALAKLKQIGIIKAETLHNKLIDNPASDLKKIDKLKAEDFTCRIKDEYIYKLKKNLEEKKELIVRDIKELSSENNKGIKDLEALVVNLDECINKINKFAVSDLYLNLLLETFESYYRYKPELKTQEEFTEEDMTLHHGSLNIHTRENILLNLDDELSYVAKEIFFSEEFDNDYKSRIKDEIIDKKKLLAKDEDYDAKVIALLTEYYTTSAEAKIDEFKQKIELLKKLQEMPQPVFEWKGIPKCTPRKNLTNFTQEEVNNLLINQNYQDLLLSLKELKSIIPDKYNQLHSVIDNENYNLKKLKSDNDFKKLDEEILKSLTRIEQKMQQFILMKGEISIFAKLICNFIEIFKEGYTDRKYPIEQASKKLKKRNKQHKSLLERENKLITPSRDSGRNTVMGADKTAGEVDSNNDTKKEPGPGP